MKKPKAKKEPKVKNAKIKSGAKAKGVKSKAKKETKVKKAKNVKSKAKKEETNEEVSVKYANVYKFDRNDFIVVNEEFRNDLRQLKEFHKRLENYELKFDHWSMGDSYYKIQK